MNGPRPVWSLLATAALLAATPVLAACGVGGPGGPPYVAEFGLGADTSEAREFVLAPVPGPHGQSSLESAFQPSVAWVDDGQYLAVVTWGSSGCPSGPDSIQVPADQEMEVRLGPLFPDRDTCTADRSGHVTVVELPRGITPTKPLSARIGDHEMTIAAVAR